MAKLLLNHFINTNGKWQRGQNESFTSGKSVNLNGSNIRIHETAITGTVLLSHARYNLSSYGNPEVYLSITFTSGGGIFLSAPLNTAIDYSNVDKLELNICYLVGNEALKSIYYKAMINAHCIYECI